jgi:hypothetical protein
MAMPTIVAKSQISRRGFPTCDPYQQYIRSRSGELCLGGTIADMKKWIALGVVAIPGLVYVHYYASARLEAMPEKIRSSPAEINAQHQLELKSETPLQ